MSPITGIAASQLRQLIYYHLDHDMLDNANFLAGRLHASEPRNPDTSHLLALTYFRQRRSKAAYDFSHKYGANGRHLGCAYIFAQACLELGRYQEGATALEKSRNQWTGKNEWDKHSETSRRHIPDAPAVSALLAKLYRAHGDFRKAGDCYIEAHKGNPFIWDAFEGLCKIGADLKVENMFKPSSDMPAAPDHVSSETGIYVDEDSRQPLAPHPNHGQLAASNNALDDPFTSTRTDSEDREHLPKVRGNSILGYGLKPLASEWDTPTTSGGGLDDDIAMFENNEDVFNGPPAAPSRRVRLGLQFETSDRPRPPALRANSEVPDDPLQAPRKPGAGGQKRTISGAASHSSVEPPRRSTRLTKDASTSRPVRPTADSAASVARGAERASRTTRPATGAKGRTGAPVVGRVVSGNRNLKASLPEEKEGKERRLFSRNGERNAVMAPQIASITVPSKQAAAQPQSDHSSEQHAMRGLLSEFRKLAVGSNAISRFQLPEAIQLFEKLPAAQRETPWVLAQLGKAQYEAADYQAAEESFARLMKIQPSRIEDMEIYSTVLWHLKKESTLSFLCLVLRETHFDAPQTWVAVGNAFSLTREHDQAISAFKRATQLDDKFAYAWTLMGHEYMADEVFDAALGAFRKAVAIDRRGYGGWYGLGKCYEKMGKLEDAERHYRIAAMINPSNSTLLVCIGVVLERLRNKDSALTYYTKALELAPQSALARFKKARVLMHLREYHHALEDLQALHNQAPDEANVHFLLGKCYKGLDAKGEALKHFTMALNLDVKAAPFVKEAIDSLGDEDEYDSDDD